MPDFISSQKCTLHSTDLNRHTLFSLAETCLCLWKKCVNHFSNLKNFQNVIRDKWNDVDGRQPESEKP